MPTCWPPCRPWTAARRDADAARSELDRLRGASTAARMLKAGDIAGACQQLPRWDKASVGGVMVSLPGLTKRRAKEMALCMEGAA